MHQFHNITSTKQHNIIRDPRSKKKTNKHNKPSVHSKEKGWQIQHQLANKREINNKTYEKKAMLININAFQKENNS
jgi:hypothetical protein